MRRRKKKNPALSTYVMIGAGVLVVGGVAFFLYEKSASAAGALPASAPAASSVNTPIPAAQVAAGATVGLSASLCAAMRNGQAPTSQDDLDACDRLGL